MKQINDNYGHIEGDYALKKVHEAIHHACPDAVIQARTGGDEFEIIAEDIAENEGVHYLEELVAYLDAFNESGGKEYDIHASYGYAAAFLRSRIPWKFSLKKVMKSCIGIK